MVQDPTINCEFKMDDGTTIYAQVEKGDGKPVVLVHGWCLSHLMWESQIDHLKKCGNYVVAIDLRGFGSSGKSNSSFSYDRWARDIGAVIADRGLKDVRLVGYSIGGAIAMHYMSTYNDPRVVKLALVAAAGPCMLQSPKNPDGLPRWEFEGAIEVFEHIPLGKTGISKGLYKQAFDTFLKLAFGNNQPTRNTPISDRLYRMFKLAKKRAVIRGLEEMRDQDLTTPLSNIRIDTEILCGRLDQFVRPGLAIKQRESLTSAPSTQIVCCQNSGHGLFFEEEKKLNDELEAFAR
jgi:pimeloyl-ACP methyl ester carboxylesterase